MRRCTLLMIAFLTISQAGCCGRVRAFFYRLFSCDGCCYPHYGFAGCGGAAYAAPAYAAPAYGAPGCATCATPAYSPMPAMPVSYTAAPGVAPVFGPSTPLPNPQVHTTPNTPTPMNPSK